MFDRYNIVNEADLQAAAQRMDRYYEQARGTLTGTLAELTKPQTTEEDAELIGIVEGGMELARGIEPPTCGLQTCEETTEHDLSLVIGNDEERKSIT